MSGGFATNSVSVEEAEEEGFTERRSYHRMEKLTLKNNFIVAIVVNTTHIVPSPQYDVIKVLLLLTFSCPPLH
jgi:uncharacterized protein YdhG (YjbR/CyaY superfamily)